MNPGNTNRNEIKKNSVKQLKVVNKIVRKSNKHYPNENSSRENSKEGRKSHKNVISENKIQEKNKRINEGLHQKKKSFSNNLSRLDKNVKKGIRNNKTHSVFKKNLKFENVIDNKSVLTSSMLKVTNPSESSKFKIHKANFDSSNQNIYSPIQHEKKNTKNKNHNNFKKIEFNDEKFTNTLTNELNKSYNTSNKNFKTQTEKSKLMIDENEEILRKCELDSSQNSNFLMKTQEMFPKFVNDNENKKKGKDNQKNKLILTSTRASIKTKIQDEKKNSTRPKSDNKSKKNFCPKNLYSSSKDNFIKKLKIENSVNNFHGEVFIPIEQSLFRGRLEDYILGKELGKGAYAVVKKGFHKLSNKKFAIKIYEKSKLLDSHRKSSLNREIEVLKKIDHPNIVKLYEVIDTSKQILLILEFIEGVSLLNYLKSKENRKLCENEAKSIFSQVLQGIQYLHSKNIYHRDIKLENIILSNGNVKIIDFGFSTCNASNKSLNFYCGTLTYMPPEIAQKNDYFGPPADIWSSGVLLFTLLTGSFPFKSLNEKELISKIVKSSYNIPDSLSVESQNLIKKILNPVASLRPNISELLLDPWFNSDNCDL